MYSSVDPQTSTVLNVLAHVLADRVQTALDVIIIDGDAKVNPLFTLFENNWFDSNRITNHVNEIVKRNLCGKIADEVIE